MAVDLSGTVYFKDTLAGTLEQNADGRRQCQNANP
jgi:hypothetical protein